MVFKFSKKGKQTPRHRDQDKCVTVPETCLPSASESCLGVPAYYSLSTESCISYSQLMVCPNCDGSGKHGLKECYRCKGQGKTAIGEPDRYEEFPLDCIKDHQIGDKHCKQCDDSYPTICKICGGLVHHRFVDEVFDDDGNEHWLYSHRCEKCGDVT